jgi:PAS domain S-box-containing protein
MEWSDVSRWLLEADHPRIVLLAGLTLVILFANFFGLEFGISVVFPHLFYLPIILASYWYPRRGLSFAIALAFLYLSLSYAISAPNPLTFAAAVARAAIFVIVGGVVAFLSRSLREEEELYRGLFDHSQAGTLLVRGQDGTITIEEANPRAAELLGEAPGTLAGVSLARYWQEAPERDRFFSTLEKEGAVHEAEAGLVKAGGQQAAVLISAGRISEGRAILTFDDITERKRMGDALRSANEKLNTLSGMTRHDLLDGITALSAEIDRAKTEHEAGPLMSFLGKLERAVRLVQRRIEQTRDYEDLGARPADWQYVQSALLAAASRVDFGAITLRVWTERLEVYADPLIGTAFHHLLDNTARHAEGADWIVVAYHITDEGCDLVFEDNGTGIPAGKKDAIFSYRPGTQAGMGLFLVREILGITGLAIREEGGPERGARFVISIPADKYRIV